MRSGAIVAPTVNGQTALRWAVWDGLVAGTLRFAALPTEANLRLWMPNALAEGAVPWIVHDHGDDLAALAQMLGRSSHARAWLPGFTTGPTGRPGDALVVPGRGTGGLLRLAGALERGRGALGRRIRRTGPGSG